MSERSDNPFEPRLGRIRSDGSLRRGRTFLSRVARSVSRSGHSGPGRGRRTGSRGQKTYGRRVVVKARFVRLSMSSARALGEHLRYLSRDDATRPEDRGQVFNRESEAADREAFVDAARGDRHHFRLIVSPEDGEQMHDMKPFVRDLVAGMEKDLGTRLQWVAAIHDNTQHPHAHIVIRGRRDDGRELVMPRAYISHGIRERAEELVTLELGPQTELERDAKLSRQSGAERLTQIDRVLARQMDARGKIDMKGLSPHYRQLNTARLRTLERLNLAQQTSRSVWMLSSDFEATLKALGEQGDIIKNIHRALDRLDGRRLQVGPVFEDASSGALTGRIIKKRLGGENHDQPTLIVDGVDGRAFQVRVANPALFEHLHKDMIVSLTRPALTPKPSDVTVAKIAKQNIGQYSETIHRAADPSAASGNIAAHVRRLEALKRNGLLDRSPEGVWSVPDDFLAQVTKSHAQQFGPDMAHVDVASWVQLKEQVGASGLSWLDTAELPAIPAYGFGQDVRLASEQRRAVLRDRELLRDGQTELGKDAIQRLRLQGMRQIGAETAAETGKAYELLPDRGPVSGRFTGTVDKAEGRFAVIERERTFTFAPWRAVLERQRGQVVSGMVCGGAVSWTLGRKKGLGV